MTGSYSPGVHTNGHQSQLQTILANAHKARASSVKAVDNFAHDL